jgi:hypothetical protein
MKEQGTNLSVEVPSPQTYDNNKCGIGISEPAITQEFSGQSNIGRPVVTDFMGCVWDHITGWIASGSIRRRTVSP